MELYAGKEYFRATKDLQKALVCASSSLYERIRAYESKNISFENIYNDDKVKYDKHGQFYTYKAHKQIMQIRLLYAYLVVDGVSVIIIADFTVKKKNNKEYIKAFDSMNQVDPAFVYANSRCVCSC